MFETGAMVLIRRNLNEINMTSGVDGTGVRISSDMERYAGKVAKITYSQRLSSMNGRIVYTLDIDMGSFLWIEEALEAVNEDRVYYLLQIGEKFYAFRVEDFTDLLKVPYKIAKNTANLTYL